MLVVDVVDGVVVAGVELGSLLLEIATSPKAVTMNNPPSTPTIEPNRDNRLRVAASAVPPGSSGCGLAGWGNGPCEL